MMASMVISPLISAMTANARRHGPAGRRPSVHELGGRDGAPVEVEVQEPAREKLASAILNIVHRSNAARIEEQRLLEPH